MSDNPISQGIQDGFVLLSITDSKFLGVCRKAVKPQYFSSQVTEDIISICYGYWDQFNRAPDQHFNEELTRFLSRKTEEEKHRYLDYLEKVCEMDVPQEGYILSRINTFVRGSEFKSAAIQFAKLVGQGEFESAKELMEKALRSGVHKEESGIHYFDVQTPSYYKSETQQERLMGTGFSVLDEKLIRGICRTDMICGLGGSKGKKTWLLGHFIRVGLYEGRKILHITCELSDEDMEKRMDRIIGGMTDQEKETYIDFEERDQEGRLIDTKRELVKSVYDQEAVMKVRRQMRRWGGDLIIKDYPPMTLTMPEVERYLDFLETQEKWLPDIVMIDYIEKMRLPFGEYRRDAIHETYMHCKRIAKERNLAIFTVSQINRAALNKPVLDKGDFAEDIRKLDSVDLVLAVSHNKQQSRANRMQAYVLANRHGSDSFGCVYTTNLDAGQMITNCWPMKFKSENDEVEEYDD